MQLDNNLQAFFALVRAGLWEQEVRLAQLGQLDFSVLYRLAEEQSVVGVVAMGLEYVDIKFPKEIVLQFVGQTLQLEQRNMAMNSLIEGLIGKLRENDIYALLIKGQGIAQCYEKPLRRVCGDVDFLLSKEGYKKAKTVLMPLASEIENEDKKRKHLALSIDNFVVELHGTIESGISKRERTELESVNKDIFEAGNVRFWMNNQTRVFLPSADNDVIIVFTHILEHFFYGGIGLRQVCDWCRLLWTYRERLDLRLLESRILRMRLMTEWRAFAALAVRDLGTPVEAMPLYSPGRKWLRKADRIRAIILETGNFGHNRDNSHYQKHSFVVYKAISFWRNTKDTFRHMMIFPVDAARVWMYRLGDGVEMALKANDN